MRDYSDNLSSTPKYGGTDQVGENPKTGPGTPSNHSQEDDGSTYQTNDARREIGPLSAIFLIFNRMIGTGIFSTPSTILALSGSVGLSLFIWVYVCHVCRTTRLGGFKLCGICYGVVTALYNVIWSYIGYSNANYALAETKNPVKTLKMAAPTALAIVGILYMLANIAYFAAVPKEEIMTSVALLLVHFSETCLGLVLSVCCPFLLPSQRSETSLVSYFLRVELYKKLPEKHWLVSVIIMLAPPPGDAYNFILNVISYPLAVVNVFVSIALLILYARPFSADRHPQHWAPPFRATWPVVSFFLLSNVYLVVAPFIPPDDGQNVYKSLPYYLHCVVGIAFFGAGAIYWFIWAQVLPRIGGYELVREHIVSDDGWSGSVFRRVKSE
ncbi:hypothetical protein DID88_010063 [Monilinia fructigena]|uniref:Uncharacterized protein n=1 Tax=Monilinia fructigena TaxID=38457 RepID=A0A395IL20_9HELO|nr:hypothetical protein DID88_010063 [Monilinia fructigena]